MRAAKFYKYGGPERLSVEDTKKPFVGEEDVCIRVVATSINGSDWEFLRGKPFYARVIGLTQPRKHVLGSDIAGTVESVGTGVTNFKKGDPVYCDNFDRLGGFAEFVSVPQSKVLRKPEALTFDEAACVPQGGVIALQGLRQHGELKQGQRVLINGAGGSAGVFAVQMAKAAGARVTVIDHANKLEFLKDLGADEAYDYQKVDLQPLENSFDKILDLVGHQSVGQFRRLLKPTGHYSIVGGRMKDIFGVLIIGSLTSLFTNKKMSILTHFQNEHDMTTVARMIEERRLEAHVCKTVSLADIRQAFQLYEAHRVLGKVVVHP